MFMCLHMPGNLHKLSYLSLTTTLGGIIIIIITIPIFMNEEKQA